ncbi:MAG TPA: hypothetical protein VKI65_13780 [Gemmataceae bacterium]|nr:hypothetical protein [Gemmataceae bacterium]
MKRMLAGCLVLSLGLWAGSAGAQNGHWRGAATQSPVQPAETSSDPTPAATLGRPVPLTRRAPEPKIVDEAVTPASYEAAPATLSRPVVRGQSADVQPMPPGTAGPANPYSPVWPTTNHTTWFGPRAQVPGPPGDPYNAGVIVDNPPPLPPPPPPPGNGGWFDGAMGAITPTGGRGWFQSDHAFDNFISPLSNAFRFEDPRSLTEWRPMFIYQLTPGSNYAFHGGDIEFLGMQARVALTERLSVVLNEFGAIWSEPHLHSGEFVPHAGFAEVQLGPKYTFLRCEETGTVAAAGLTFDIPAGAAKVFQDTGTLSLVPYVSAAQNFGRSSYGSFNFMGTLGYSFSVDNGRSDYFYTSLHLDYDFANAHTIYPLVELNWYHYTTAGKSRDLNFEGRDLFNFGSRRVSGNDNLGIAFGLRYKFTECAQVGIGAEVPITGRRDLMDFRLMTDLILRY